MRRRRIKRIGRSFVFAAVIVMLAVSLAVFDSTNTVDAASLKHIDEIVAQSGTFNILEIVPDTAASSFGYYVAGQEPIAAWQTAIAGLTSPAERGAFVNELFGRLASKGVLGSDSSSPLRYTYYDGTNHSYYTEAYEVDDAQGWTTLHLNAAENAQLTGTMTETPDGPYRANYAYLPQTGGGYNQNIWYFSHTETPSYGQETYYYSPVFTKVEEKTDLTGWDDVVIYTKDQNGHYFSDPDKRTVREYLNQGGFDVTGEYYYVDPAMTGSPGSFAYAAVVKTDDADDAPGDGFISVTSGDSYFTRTITSFTYVRTGGNYAYSSAGSTVYKIIYTDVYFKAGYVNNNLFKTQVFGLDSGNMNAIDVTVTVRRAGDVSPADIKAAGMIYLSAGTDINRGGVTTTYTVQNDIGDSAAAVIYNYAANGNPVIIDEAIIQGISMSTPPESVNIIQKLCLLSLQSNITPTTETSLSGLTIDWSTLAYMTGDADKTFVNNNLYCFNAFNNQSLGGAANITALVTPLFSDPFALGVYGDGFSAVMEEIRNENFLRTIAGQQDLLPENVTVANAVRHIINFRGRRTNNAKTSVKVLDLQPAKVTSASWLTTDTVRSWINNSLPADKITIVHMTTGEFAGKIEDIVETYDMIYIGMSTETMNKSGGNTVYNDTSMNGLIYTNIGDKYYGSIELAGIRNQDYITVDGTKAINGATGTNANLFRFSGNDITKTAVTELRRFVSAGYPIILADGFVSGSGINTSRVDSSSYMYEAISGVYGTYANVMTQSYAAVSDETVIQYLNVSKPALTLASTPVEYADNPNAALTAGEDGYFYLSYTFSISNVTDPTPISTTYNCRLYIDLNADGRYASGEELDDIVVTRLSDGALILPLSDPGGEQYYALSADIQYRVERQMPDDYVGIIPWKLEAVKNGADQIHASAFGFTRISAEGNTQTIKVLQIMQAGTTNSKLNLSKQLTVNPSGANSQLRGTDGKYYTGIYGKLIADLKDFDVSIDVIENDELEAVGGADAILEYLEAYDMLIIGFNDCYDGIGSKGASAIVSYIESGKSVLFTHDTTSLTQVPYYNYPMAVNGTAPKVRTLNQTDVLYNTSASEYASIDGNIAWAGSYSTTTPPYVRQYNPTYIVFMSSNVTTSNEQDYYNARVSGEIYRLTSTGYSAISNPTSYTSFKNTTGSAPVLYVYCTAASGWYGTGNFTNRYSLTTTNNFTKFSGGTRYTCTGMTYYYANGSKPNNRYENLTTASYPQIMQDIYYSTPNSYSVVGTYDAASNTYNIGGTTYWPATGTAFPQSTLYDRDPANSYTLSTIPNGISDWGYYFNTVIRDAVGLDRYGVTSSLLGSLVNVTAPMPFDSITTVLQNDRSVAFAPKSGRASTVNEYQGYTNYALIRFPGSGNTYRYTANNYSNRETTNISQVNKGQITTYPYNVNTASFGGNDGTITSYGGSYMKIGLTHEQYFQINMNTDDIVVWYCMSNYSGISGGVVSFDDSSYYDDVPNDCVNAYYIYNKGNVTYSGVGHSSDAGLYTGSSIGQQYINEAKLFVNTMIAAYQSGEQAPTVRIKKDAHGTADLSQKFVLVDDDIAANPGETAVLEEFFDPMDDSRAVYYRISDPNVGGNKRITAEYFVSVDNGTTLTPLAVGDDGNPIVTYNADGTAVDPEASLKGGYVYLFYMPNANCLDHLKIRDRYSMRIYVKVTTKIGAKTLTDSDYLELRKLQLYPLV